MTGLELRALRKKIGLSRVNFAGLIDISIHTLDAWEGGKRNIPDTKAELIRLKLKDIVPINLKGKDGKLYTKNRNGLYENIRDSSDLLSSEVFKDYDHNSEETKKSDPIVIKNKNGLVYEELPNGKFKVEVPKVPYKAYASFIEVFGDEYAIKEQFETTMFTVDHPGKGNYISFTVGNDSMNGGSLNDTPNGAEVLCRELQRHHWKDGFRCSDYGWIIIGHSGMFHKDIEGPNEKGEITCSSRNPSPEFPDFEISLNEVHSIWKVIKRTF